MNFLNLRFRKKSWGVFIYACGNNDLEPEIYRAASALKIDIAQDVGIAIQLARAPKKLVSLLRPEIKNCDDDENWHGVKRYLLNNSTGAINLFNQPAVVEDFGSLNMAQPSSLYDFLVWAFSVISAKYYMVILSGHGAGFIGAMADFTHGRPQIMGIPQMAEAFQRVGKHMGKKIDILIMDACYMNLVENLYELSLRGAVDIFIGAGGLIPLEGYAYGKIMQIICRRTWEPRDVAAEIRDYHNAQLPAYRSTEAVVLDKKLFVLLKQQLSELGRRLNYLGIKPNSINKSAENLIGLEELLTKAKMVSNDDIVKKCVSNSFDLFKKINLPDSIADWNSVNMFCPGYRENLVEFAKYYYSLQFSKADCWLQWLGGDKIGGTDILLSDSFNSMPLPLDMLTQHLLSLNANMTVDEIHRIYKQLDWTD